MGEAFVHVGEGVGEGIGAPCRNGPRVGDHAPGRNDCLPKETNPETEYGYAVHEETLSCRRRTGADLSRATDKDLRGTGVTNNK